MNYSWEQHLDTLADWLAIHEAPDEVRPNRLFALIDAGQAPSMSRRIAAIADPGRAVQLFVGTFAEAARPLSPLLMELDPVRFRAIEQLKLLNRATQDLPVLSVLGSKATCADLLAHLRAMLLITIDGTKYLWRLADTQTLAATMSVLDDEQRNQVCGPCPRWWVVDHESRLSQLAPPTSASGPGPWGAPLVLDDIQEQALLTAAAGPMLASQLRALSPDFNHALTHAQQSAFVDRCLSQARIEAVCHEEELVTWSLQRWRDARGESIPGAELNPS